MAKFENLTIDELLALEKKLQQTKGYKVVHCSKLRALFNRIKIILIHK